MCNPSSAPYQPLRVAVYNNPDDEQQKYGETEADYIQVSKDAPADPTARPWLRHNELRSTTPIRWSIHSGLFCGILL
jgi:hypothetical protein